jgi:hypothetical protein
LIDIRNIAKSVAARAFDATNGPLSVVIKRPSSKSVDVATGVVTKGADVSYTISRGMLSEYSKREIDGTTILSSDRRIALLVDDISGSGLSGEITTSDRVIYGGKTFSVVDVKYDSLGVAVILQVRT